MPTNDATQNWQGQTLHDNHGDKIGSIAEVYLDRQSEQPEWLAVKTGLFGSKLTFVPVREATSSGDGVRVTYEKALVKDAPRVEADGELSEDEERRLYQHYSLDFGEFDYGTDYDADRTQSFGGRPSVGNDVSGPETDNAMTRSEEQLRVGVTSQARGRARLRKRIVTENVETTVPVTREEVRVEREPITDANLGNAMSGPAISEEEHEVVLHAERPVVEKRVVPKERVRLDKETVTNERTVSDEVRKEQIEIDGERIR